METKKTNILVVRFKNRLQRKEIPYFRGAVIRAIKDADPVVLFHNHIQDQFRYGYPLIQYKSIDQKAAIVCIEKGTEAIGKLFSTCNFAFEIGNRQTEMEVESIIATQAVLQIQESKVKYTLQHWLPLSQVSYQKYKTLDGLIDKVQFLENILIGNILSFAKGVGVYFDKQITACITGMGTPETAVYKDVKMLCFNIEFESNVLLPDFIGLGKGSSHGYGTIIRTK